MAAKLLATARKLPPGPERHGLLKEIGRFRAQQGPRFTASTPRAEGEEEVSSLGPQEERVIWRERFQAEVFDFRGKSIFTRFDGCMFVKCTLLIDQDTEQLTFLPSACSKTATSIGWNRLKSAGYTFGIISLIAR